MLLFFDTETTGIINPRLVQLAALLTDNEGKEISHVNLIIRPIGFNIPENATAIHGISHEFASDNGVSVTSALTLFFQFMEVADLLIAHNLNYDISVIKNEIQEYFDNEITNSLFNSYKNNSNNYCTMLNSTNICKIQKQNGGYKWPKLQEVYNHAFGKEFANAHNALADVMACKEVYFWLKNLKEKQNEI